MTLLDAVSHLLNFAAPALSMAAITSAAAKAMWRKELCETRWMVLASVSATATFAVEVAGLAITGRDAKMEVYAAMAVACAASLWWMTRRRRYASWLRPYAVHHAANGGSHR